MASTCCGCRRIAGVLLCVCHCGTKVVAVLVTTLSTQMPAGWSVARLAVILVWRWLAISVLAVKS
eukprot:4057004-Amphidinium_carterae.1